MEDDDTCKSLEKAERLRAKVKFIVVTNYFHFSLMIL